MGYSGDYKRDYEVNLLESNKITISFKNIINRDFSVVQYKILPAPGNDLYVESEGHQNYSWGAYITVFYEKDHILISETLRDADLSTPFYLEGGRTVEVFIEITLPQYLPNGTYCVRFVIVSREYEDKQGVDSYIHNGTTGGARITDSLASKQFIHVIRENPIIITQKTETVDYVYYALITILVMGMIALAIGIIKLRRYKEYEG